MGIQKRPNAENLCVSQKAESACLLRTVLIKCVVMVNLEHGEVLYLIKQNIIKVMKLLAACYLVMLEWLN